MKLAGIPVSVILILLVTAFLCQKYSLSSSPLFLFSLFNSIILAVMVGSFRSYTYEVDEFLPFFRGSDYEHGFVNTHDDDDDDIAENNGNEDDCDDEYHGSDGYVEDDDDDNGSDDEVGWEEDEEGCDDNLQKRIEDFIAKSYNGWKEENLRDKFNHG